MCIRDRAKLLAPADPSKIVAIGKNYVDHINEMSAMAAPALPEEPEVFLKPPSAILNPGEDIVYPIGAQRVDYDCLLYTSPAAGRARPVCHSSLSSCSTRCANSASACCTGAGVARSTPATRSASRGGTRLPSDRKRR